MEDVVARLRFDEPRLPTQDAIPFGRLASFLRKKPVFYEPVIADDDVDDVKRSDTEGSREEVHEAEPSRSSGVLERACAEATRNSCEFFRILYSNGFVWVATRNWAMVEWSKAGVIDQLECAGRWFDVLPQEAWPAYEESYLTFRRRSAP